MELSASLSQKTASVWRDAKRIPFTSNETTGRRERLANPFELIYRADRAFPG